METKIKPHYTIVKELEDGQRVPVSTFESYGEAKGLIDSLNEYWPGEYAVLETGVDAFVRHLPVPVPRPQLTQ
jgi:hypothetical protein